MEITSFVLGMLTVTGLAIALLVVLGVVKIYKQKEQIQELQRSLEESFRTLDDQRIRDVDEIYRELESRQKDLVSYVDSRIDKIQSKKELIK